MSSAFFRISAYIFRLGSLARRARLCGISGGFGSLGGLSAQFHKVLGAANIDPSTLLHQNSSFNLFGFLGILFVTVVLIIGIKESANFNSVIVIVKVAVLLVFIGLGANYIFGHRAEATANWTPFLPKNTGVLWSLWMVRNRHGRGRNLFRLHRV